MCLKSSLETRLVRNSLFRASIRSPWDAVVAADQNCEIALALSLQREKMMSSKLEQAEQRVNKLQDQCAQQEKKIQETKMLLKMRQGMISKFQKNGNVPEEDIVAHLSKELQMLKNEGQCSSRNTALEVENMKLREQLESIEEMKNGEVDKVPHSSLRTECTLAHFGHSLRRESLSCVTFEMDLPTKSLSSFIV